MDQDARIKVLQMVAQMRPGGVETWLLRVLRHIDRSRFQVDFLVHTTESRAYDEEVLRLGARIIPCPGPNRPWSYGRRLRQRLREFGPYQVVHSHLHHFSGFVMRQAHREGVPIRVAHCHSDTRLMDARASLPRRAYLWWMRHHLERHATLGLAASAEAAAAQYGPYWRQDPRWIVHHCGVELAAFHEHVDPNAVRKELGLPGGKRVIGHVGRLSLPKNHRFWIRVAQELARRDPDLHFLIVGDGELRAEVAQWVEEAGLKERITLAGARNDIARVLIGAMDLFLFPSTWEGLPVSMVEAQAAGLPCVYSDIISSEVAVVPELVTAVSLDQPVGHWADVVQGALTNAQRPSPADALTAVEASSYNILHDVAGLERIYSGHAT